jgi:tellurite resistance protein TerC
VLHWLHADVWHAAPQISTPVSLAVILVVLVVTTVASLRASAKRAQNPDHSVRSAKVP